jgi:hypothetical protein
MSWLFLRPGAATPRLVKLHEVAEFWKDAGGYQLLISRPPPAVSGQEAAV